MTRTLVARDIRSTVDTFTRSVTGNGSAGTADRGPSARMGVGAGGSWDDVWVDGSAAKLRVDPGANGSRLVFASGVASRDVDVRFSFSLDKLPTVVHAYINTLIGGGDFDSGGWGQTAWELVTDVGTAGAVSFWIDVYDKDRNSQVEQEYPGPDLTVVAGSTYWVNVLVAGRGDQTRIRWKVWADGSAEPDWVVDEVPGIDARRQHHPVITDNEICPNVEIGLNVFGAGNLPIVMAVDNVSISGTRRSVSQRIVDGFSRVVVDGWGAPDSGGPRWSLRGSSTGVVAADMDVSNGVASVVMDGSTDVTAIDMSLLLDGNHRVKYRIRLDVTPTVPAGKHGPGSQIETYNILKHAGTGLWAKEYGPAAYFYLCNGPSGGLPRVDLWETAAWSVSDVAVISDYGVYVGGDWWWVEAECRDRMIRARMWPDGETVPDWQVELEDPNMPVHGLHLNIGPYMDGATSPVVISYDDLEVTGERASATRVFQDKFSRTVASGWGVPDLGLARGDGAGDYSLQFGWEVWQSGTQECSVTPGAGVTLSNAATTWFEAWVYNDKFGNSLPAGDSTIRVKFSSAAAPTTASGVSTAGAVSVGVDAHWIASSGWACRWQVLGYSDVTELFILRSDAGATYASGSVGTLIEAGEDYWLAAETSGTTVRLKFWKDGTAEPDWQISGTWSHGDGLGAFAVTAWEGVSIRPNPITFKEITMDKSRRLA